jgi:hypothetical protein
MEEVGFRRQSPTGVRTDVRILPDILAALPELLTTSLEVSLENRTRPIGLAWPVRELQRVAKGLCQGFS